MKLDDALLYFILDTDGRGAGDAAAAARAAIAGGADAVQIGVPGGPAPSADIVRAVTAACREFDALALAADRPELALACETDGIVIACEGASFGVVRAMLRPGQLLGLYAAGERDATVALELTPDFLLCGCGRECGALFHQFRARSPVTLFAAGIATTADAAALVEGGLLRLAIEGRCLAPGEDLTEQVAVFARMIGRIV